MWLFYLMAFIPAVVGGVLFFVKPERFFWQSWLICSIIGFPLAGLFHLIIDETAATDYETWSGQVTVATFHPFWVERYEVAIYRTESYRDAQGHRQTRQVFDHNETRYRNHSEYWDCDDSLGQNHSISQDFFDEVHKKFGGEIDKKNAGHSGFHSGDPNIYIAHNYSHYIFPATMTVSFYNPILAGPSNYSFAKVPENIKVFTYPANLDWRQSNRLLGTAGISFHIFDWDCLNARLGPTKKVNLIICGFDLHSDSSMGPYQEAAWIGGKKNDLVVCYGGGQDFSHPAWVYAFGWTEEALVKRNLETLFLNGPADNSLIPAIEKEVENNYVIKKWKKFNYMTIDVPTWTYFLYFFLLIIIETIVIIYFMIDDDWKKLCQNQNRNFQFPRPPWKSSGWTKY